MAKSNSWNKNVLVTINSPTSAANRLNIISGTLKLSSASTLSPYFGSQTICGTAGSLWINNSGASISQVGVNTLIGAGSPTVAGELRIDSGILALGSGNNLLTFTTTTINSIVYGSRLVMKGGTLNMFGGVTFTANSAVYFIMSGGDFNINPQSAYMLDAPEFESHNCRGYNS